MSHCCGFCATQYALPEIVPTGSYACCPQCGKRPASSTRAELRFFLAAVCTAAGMLLLTPAFTQPMLSISDLHRRNSIGLVSGIQELFHREEYLLAGVLGFFSGVLPCVKFVGLAVLCSRYVLPIRAYRHIYHFVKFTGPMGMLDVYFTAVTLIAFRISNIFVFTVEAGMAAFTAMVVLNILASNFFDPSIFKKELQ